MCRFSFLAQGSRGSDSPCSGAGRKRLRRSRAAAFVGSRAKRLVQSRVKRWPSEVTVRHFVLGIICRGFMQLQIIATEDPEWPDKGGKEVMWRNEVDETQRTIGKEWNL